MPIWNRFLLQTSLKELADPLPKGLNTMIGSMVAIYLVVSGRESLIARALLRNPDVILLDEATSALDSISETKIQVALEALTKNKTTFVVAHRLSTIKNADKIVVLKNGKVEETGTYEQLMNQMVSSIK